MYHKATKTNYQIKQQSHKMQDFEKKPIEFLYSSNEQLVLEMKISLQQHQTYEILTDTFYTAHAVSVHGKEKTLQKEIEKEHTNGELYCARGPENSTLLRCHFS